MATRIIDDSKLNDIAAAIQAKDSGGRMTVDDMPDRIDALPTGGTLIPKTITENGVYNAADDDADGYDVVTVDVESWANPTSFAMISDIVYADEILPIFINICPNHGQWFIAKKDYTNTSVEQYTCLGGIVIYSNDGTMPASCAFRSTAYWNFSVVSGHYKANAYAGDIFYIYDVSSIT